MTSPPPAGTPYTLLDLRQARARQQRPAVVTAYDATCAALVDAAGIDIVLVGDSLGMVVQGHATSLPVTLDEMVYHTRCVSRVTRRALVVGDLPFMSYQLDARQALESAGRLVKEGGAQVVKLEGGERAAAAIAAIVAADIPVMGHVGMTPQSVHRFGGFKVQRDSEQILRDAVAVEKAGASAVVVECVPADLGREVTERLTIPTIGIGAGGDTTGQVLVLQDLLGMSMGKPPRFVKAFAPVGEMIRKALADYAGEVRAGTFPGPEHAYR